MGFYRQRTFFIYLYLQLIIFLVMKEMQTYKNANGKEYKK